MYRVTHCYYYYPNNTKLHEGNPVVIFIRLALAGAGRTSELVLKEDDLQYGNESKGNGDQEEYREDEQHMGQDRVQEDPGIDGQQAEADARGFRTVGRKRPHIHQVRPWLHRGRGLRPDGVHRANNVNHPGLCISNQSMEQCRVQQKK